MKKTQFHKRRVIKSCIVGKIEPSEITNSVTIIDNILSKPLFNNSINVGLLFQLFELFSTLLYVYSAALPNLNEPKHNLNPRRDISLFLPYSLRALICYSVPMEMQRPWHQNVANAVGKFALVISGSKLSQINEG